MYLLFALSIINLNSMIMKKYLPSVHSVFVAAILLISITSPAQMVQDVVSQGAGYANQVWYSLENGEMVSAPKTEWDIAFSIGTFSSSIHINAASGNIAKVYPNGSINDWESVDVSGFDGWPTLNNSATSWELGAFDQNNSGSSLDFGWGMYNPVTHFVTGDSIYIVQTTAGELKKLKLVNLTLAGVYNFEIADINGDNTQVLALDKGDYEGKVFGYYSIINNEFLDREPASTSWDLLFTQYTDYVPSAYTVAGVLHHPDVTVIQADGVDQESFEDYSQYTFSEEINTIGYDWKTFTGMGFEVASDVVYFVQEQDGDVWKIVFTGFGGSSNGDYMFNKEKLGVSNISELDAAQIVGVYPNPADEFVQVIINSNTNNNALYQIYDLQGRMVLQNNLNVSAQLQTKSIDVSALNAGLYVLSLQSNGSISQHKFQVK